MICAIAILMMMREKLLVGYKMRLRIAYGMINIHFILDSFTDLLTLIDNVQQLLQLWIPGGGGHDFADNDEVSAFVLTQSANRRPNDLPIGRICPRYCPGEGRYGMVSIHSSLYYRGRTSL